MKENSLAKMKRKRNIILVSVFLFLGGLIAFTVLRPDAESENVSMMKDFMLAKKPGNINAEDRKNIRNMLKKLSPKTKKKLIKEVMRGRLEEMRSELSGITEDEKRKKIDKMVIGMRKRFNKMTSEQRNKARERMNTPEGKESMREALNFFYTEFTPSERQFMDPLVEEFTIQMGR